MKTFLYNTATVAWFIYVLSKSALSEPLKAAILVIIVLCIILIRRTSVIDKNYDEALDLIAAYSMHSPRITKLKWEDRSNYRTFLEKRTKYYWSFRNDIPIKTSMKPYFFHSLRDSREPLYRDYLKEFCDEHGYDMNQYYIYLAMGGHHE